MPKATKKDTTPAHPDAAKAPRRRMTAEERAARNRRRALAALTSQIPAVTAPPEPREMELIGLTDDGRLVLWSNGRVQPITKFETDAGGWIEHGHYVIDWKGHAITVHCANQMDRSIMVLFMMGTHYLTMPRTEIEAILLGRVMREYSEEEMVARIKALAKAFRDKKDTPERQRGRIEGGRNGADPEAAA